jgi:hypothetical protein
VRRKPACVAARAESERIAKEQSTAAAQQVKEEAVARQKAEVARQATAQREAATLRATVANLASAGFITRIDGGARNVPGHRRIFVNGFQWSLLHVDDKENFVQAMSNNRKATEKLPQVTIHDRRSGQELASYGAFSGIDIK